MDHLHQKSIVIDNVWLYSKYLGNQLAFLCQIEENVPASIIYLLNLLENTLKSYVDDYESNFQYVIKQAFKSGKLSQTEYEFLNNKSRGIRKLRNVFAHANLSKFSFQIDGDRLIYPLTENENCQLLYSKISDIIFNIILKVALNSLITDLSVNTDLAIKNLKYHIISISPDEILLDKGIESAILPGWCVLSESEQYRQAENASNVKMLSCILSGLSKHSQTVNHYIFNIGNENDQVL